MVLQFFKKHTLAFVGIGVGAIVGFFYWQQIGCVSGTCAITSNPINSTLYGSLMGFLLVNAFKKEPKTKSNI